MLNCISDLDLDRFNSGDMPDAEASVVTEHLRDCKKCTARNSAILSRQNELLQHVRDMDSIEIHAAVDAAFDRGTDADGSTRAASRPGESSPPIHRNPAAIARSHPLHDFVGPYKLLEMLGEGGFGVVYLAEQTEPIRRRVALKILKLGMDTRQVIARFEAERQALAMMDHPNVARVFDAGATELGRPYFVMEHVPGVPITDYCDRHKLSTHERLSLFMLVCDAVQHAHQKGIIHRDLKPSNVLVTMQDAKPVPKVIDFGVAKAVHHRLSDQTIFTEMGQIVGTPEYMSPEQAEMTGLNIDTRTDIYSLGVLLYELLVGTLPFESNSLRAAGIAEVQRMIREDEPQKPSTRLSSLAVTRTTAKLTVRNGASSIGECTLTPSTARKTKSLQEIASSRRSDPRTLMQQLRGDLDWITMKAMEKDRTRRYPSASELSADILRHLNNEPVTAGPPSRVYRLRKFVRRNGVWVGASVIVFLVMIGAVVTTTWQARRALRAEMRATQERDTAVAVTDFLQDMLNSVDPDNAQGREPTVREVLDMASEKIDLDVRDQPKLRATLEETIGSVYFALGLYDRAEPHLTSAHGYHVRAFGEDHPNSIEVQRWKGRLLAARGRLAEAETVQREIIARLEKSIGPNTMEVAKLKRELADTLDSLSRYSDAEKLVREALETTIQLRGPNDAQTLAARDDVATVLKRKGDFQACAKLCRETMEARRAMFGPTHNSTAGAMNNLADVLIELNEIPEALRLFTDAVGILQKNYPEGHPVAARAMTNLAYVLRRENRLNDAEKLANDALDMRKKLLEPDHPDIATSYQTLGQILEDKREFDEAEKCMHKAYDLYVASLGKYAYPTAVAAHSLACVYREMEKFDKAAEKYQEAIDIAERVLDKKHPLHIRMRVDLAKVLGKMGRYDECEQEMKTAYRISMENTGPDSKETLDTIETMVYMFISFERWKDAVEWRLKLPESRHAPLIEFQTEREVAAGASAQSQPATNASSQPATSPPANSPNSR